MWLLLARLVTLLSIAIWCNYCGRSPIRTQGPEISYYLERVATNATQNLLLVKTNIEAPEELANYQLVLSGIGFRADVELNQKISLPSQVLIEYDEEGLYTLGITVFNGDGLVFIDDELQWEYSLEKPFKPIVSFTEKATSDEQVVMLLASNLERKTVEIWIEGDIASSQEGFWMLIPGSLDINLKVSASDGQKAMKVKYRNIYGNESELVNVSILKKSIGPQNCQAMVQNQITPSPQLRLYVAAEDSQELFFNVTGDLDRGYPYASFKDHTEALISLEPSFGEKKITVTIKDLADNSCQIPINIELRQGYVEYSSKIKDEPLWTDNRFVTLINDYHYLPNDKPEMYIKGGVKPSEKTFQWVPYQSEIVIELAPVEGNRFVYVSFRYKEGHETEPASFHIYLQPIARLYEEGGDYKLSVSNIKDLQYLSVTGCQQTYQQVAYAESYSCTPSGSETVSVTFVLRDGSEVTKTASF